MDFTPSIFPYKTPSFSALRRKENYRKRSQARTPTVPAEVGEEQLLEEDEDREKLLEEDEDREDEDREHLLEEIRNLRRERDEARETLLKTKLSADSVKGDDQKCRLMTGLSWSVFQCLRLYLEKFIKVTNHQQFKLSTEDQLFITLLKLRQNAPTALLSHTLGLGQTTVRDMLARWINLLHAKIGFLVHWPDRECIFKTIPPHFRAEFPRLTSIIDCFEIRIESPKNLKAR